MEQLLSQINLYKSEMDAVKAADKEALENFRIKYLGTKGLVKNIMGEMKNVAVDKKKEAGQLLNEFKLYAESLYANLGAAFEGEKQESGNGVDLSLPGNPLPLGSRHPISIVQNKIISIFHRLGFSVAEGPEIEDDQHNFNALNMPENHPARDMQDTFYISQNPDWLLRTHTSSVQIREMEKGVLPLRIICPGRVYRNETISARAHCFFNQVEGLYIAENVSFADLKQTLYFFVQEMFGDKVKIRFRPSYFPFTEPSAQIFNEEDFNCFVGSTWSFNKRNSLGSYTISANGAECVAVKREIRWSVYEATGEPKLFQFKRLDSKLKEMDENSAGFRFTIVQLNNNSMQLKSDIMFEGKPASFIYNFVRI